MKIQSRLKDISFKTVVISLVAGLVIGGSFINEINERVDIPLNQKIATLEFQFIKTLKASHDYRSEDEEKTKILHFLAKEGSFVAYEFLINGERIKAFKNNGVTSPKVSDEQIDSTDTRDGDKLLIEAIDNLSDADLRSVLSSNQILFDQQTRAAMRQTIENPEISNWLVFQQRKSLHSSLTEAEKAKLQNCFNKLKATLADKDGKPEIIDSYGTCSQKSNYEPYKPYNSHYGLWEKIINLVKF